MGSLPSSQVFQPTMKPPTKSKAKSKTKLIQSLEEEEANTSTALSFKLTRVAVSQICQSVVGFDAAQLSALETLTLITTKFLEQVAKLTSSYSHESNRTESNLFDLINALHDMQGLGFITDGSSDSCLLNSNVLREILHFVKCTDEIPFAKPIPQNHKASLSLFPPQLSNLNSNSNCRGLHIPKWLPPFPDPTTYKESKEMVCITRCKSHLWENLEFVQEKENTP